MALRGAGASSCERIASPSRSRSNARDSATVPETTTATQRMPATTAAGGRAPSTTNAKLKISTVTTASNVIVANTSRLRHSMRRSLAATRNAWRMNPGGDAAVLPWDPRRVPPPPRWDCGGEAASVPTRNSATGCLPVDGAQRVRRESARPRLVADEAPAAQDDDLVGDRGGGFQIVGHQDHRPARGALGGQLGLQPGRAGGIQRGRRF